MWRIIKLILAFIPITIFMSALVAAIIYIGLEVDRWLGMIVGGVVLFIVLTSYCAVYIDDFFRRRKKKIKND